MGYLKTILVINILVFYCINIYGSDVKYPVSDIPEELKENANAVVRAHNHNIRILDPGHAVQKENFVITILNKSADNLAIFSEHYSKLFKLKSYSMIIYDKNGNRIKKVKQSEFKDYSATPDFVLFSDNRVIYYEPQVNNYPYTVEYELEADDYSLHTYLKWLPRSSFDVAVQEAEISISVPNDIKIHVYSRNVADSAKEIISGNEKITKWSAKNLKAISYEPYSGGLEEISPFVIVTPDKFIYEGYEGKGASWKDQGEFFFKLITSDNILSEKTVNEINTLTRDIKDKTQKVKVLYQYMQNKTRYVAVEVGIGGIKPLDASLVDKYNYGDCKALTNYMKTLLSNVGIESYYTHVNAGRNNIEIITEFPHDQFNHVFLCVPVEKDTIWLECTNQKNPFGFLGSFTSNRHVLLNTPEGGKLVKTPEIIAENSVQIRKADVFLDELGNGNAGITTYFTGIQFDFMNDVYYLNADDQKKHLYEEIDISNFKLNDIKYVINNESNPSISENLKIDLNNYSSSTGKRIFLPLNLMNRIHNVPMKLKERKTSFNLKWPYLDIDTIVYNVPNDLKVEFIPEKKEIKTEFGEYKCEVINSGKSITYIRRLKQKAGKYAPSKYNDYLEFRKQIMNADNLKIALIKGN